MYGTLTKQQQAELAALKKKRKTILPAEVVDFARDPNTALHSRFTWEDSEAAEKWRLHEARNILRVAVFVPKGSTKPIRAYVSLRDDRSAAGGYRSVVDVLSDAELRDKMLREALEEFRLFQQKYRVLSELAPLFEAAARVRKQKARAKASDNGHRRRAGNLRGRKPAKTRAKATVNA